MSRIIPNHMADTMSWVGRVEDRADPMQIGRVRVRVFGSHTEDTSLIPTSELPWAIPLADSASIGGVGNGPPSFMIGTIVSGYWLDGKDQQIPVIWGALSPVEGIMSGDGLINQNGILDSNYNVPGNVTYVGDGPVWLQVARGEIGTKEIRGGSHNPRILEYLKTVGLGNSGDEQPWCNAFLAWALKNSGQSIAGMTGMAKSPLSASCFETIDTPLQGAIAVFNRPPDPRDGHSAFVVGVRGGNLRILGGNQGNAVTITGKSMQRLAGFRWPRGASKTGFEPETL